MATAKREPEAGRNLDGNGMSLIPWEKVQECLEQGLATQTPEAGGPGRHTSWLATVRPDGRPHVVPVGVLLIDDILYFTSGAATRKSRNLAQNEHCVITVATRAMDLVVEGKAIKVSDRTRLQYIAEACSAQGWPASVSDDSTALTAEYSAPSAGPAPWEVYEVTVKTIFALGAAEPYGATRWNF